MKIVLQSTALTSYPNFASDLQNEFREANIVLSNPDTLHTDIQDADAVFGVPDPDVLLEAKRLKWIACPAIGVNFLMNRPDIINSDVVLTNSRYPGNEPHAEPLADHVIGMMLILAHRWPDLLSDQRAHRWGLDQYHGSFKEINGRTMGILAVGAIGSAVARRAAAFGMRVYAVDKKLTPVPEGVQEVWGPDKLDDLLRVSDWLVIAPPLTHETAGLINRRRLKLMKKGSNLLVISRGGIVDEEALVEALKSEHLAGAGLDVFAQEPLPQDSPFWDLKNVLITPHTAHVTPEMPINHLGVFQENLRRFLTGKPFLYTCDKQAGY